MILSCWLFETMTSTCVLILNLWLFLCVGSGVKRMLKFSTSVVLDWCTRFWMEKYCKKLAYWIEHFPAWWEPAGVVMLDISIIFLFFIQKKKAKIIKKEKKKNLMTRSPVTTLLDGLDLPCLAITFEKKEKKISF